MQDTGCGLQDARDARFPKNSPTIFMTPIHAEALRLFLPIMLDNE
jgi:hypothetical protein